MLNPRLDKDYSFTELRSSDNRAVQAVLVRVWGSGLSLGFGVSGFQGFGVFEGFSCIRGSGFRGKACRSRAASLEGLFLGEFVFKGFRV